MKIKIIKYDVERNQFNIDCDKHPEYDIFDPFVSSITNGDKYLNLNLSLEGKILDIDVYPHGRTLLLSKKGEEQYLKFIKESQS